MNPFLVVMAMSILLAVPNLGTCGDKEEAKRRFDAGNALLKEGDFETAAVEFELSVKLYPTKAALFNLANCYKGAKKYGKALAAYDRLDKDYGNALSDIMRQKMQKDMKDILTLIAELTLKINPTGASVEVDGDKVGLSPLVEPLKVRPGKHEITVTLKDHEPISVSVTLTAGDKKTLNISLSKSKEKPLIAAVQKPEETDDTVDQEPAENPGSALKTAGWISVGVGGALLVGGVITGVMAKKANSDLGENCPNGCYDTYYDDIDKRDKLALTTDILLGVGGAVAATGIILLIVGAKKGGGEEEDLAEGPEVSLLPTIGGLAVTGRF